MTLTPIEKLEAAIERLEGFRSPDSWVVYDDHGINAIRKVIGERAGRARPPREGWEEGTSHAVGIDYSLADALLVVILHRTIDAQLYILTEAWNRARLGLENHTIVCGLRLADAVLGGK